MEETIGIIGPIGTFEYRGKTINGVQLDDIVAAVNTLPEGTETIYFDVATPGGLVPVGKAIYSYIRSLNSRYKIVMRQVGDIASIGTYFWFASDRRMAAKGVNPHTGKKYLFNIHNPWNPHTEGDAAAHEEEAARLRTTENEMAGFYSKNTGIPVEGILPLMGVNAMFDADRAVSLKFATETYSPINQAAYNPMTPSEKKTLLSEVVAAFKNLLAAAPAPAAAAPAPAPAPTDAPSPDGMPDYMGKPVLIDGLTPLDGVYTIIKGVITAVEPVEEELNEPPAAAAPAPAPAAPVSFDALLETNKEKLESLFGATLDKALAAQKTAHDKEITELKKLIKTPHAPAGFVPANKADDIKEWNRSLAANEHAVMKKETPDVYRRLFYAKFGKEPNM